MGEIIFTNRTSRVTYEGELRNVLRELSQTQYLRNAYLPEEIMPDADLHEAKLPFVNFSHSDLHGTNFKGAVLRYANFRGCNLKGCNFDGADLVGAVFNDRDDLKLTAIQGATFKGAYMKDVRGIDIPADAFDADAPKDEHMPSVHHWK